MAEGEGEREGGRVGERGRMREGRERMIEGEGREEERERGRETRE